jgi:hypothetical protein
MRTKGVRMRVTVRKDLAEWVDGRVKTDYFGSRSHAVD